MVNVRRRAAFVRVDQQMNAPLNSERRRTIGFLQTAIEGRLW
jgi:hypothetical protein